MSSLNPSFSPPSTPPGLYSPEQVAAAVLLDRHLAHNSPQMSPKRPLFAKMWPLSPFQLRTGIRVNASRKINVCGAFFKEVLEGPAPEADKPASDLFILLRPAAEQPTPGASHLARLHARTKGPPPQQALISSDATCSQRFGHPVRAPPSQNH